MKHKLYKLLPLLGVLLVFTACSGNSQTEWHGHNITGIMPDLVYDLTDENNASTSAKDYAGKVRLVFFGYTSCPDICPVILGHLKTAIADLPTAEQEQVRVLFVSVDPQRDTPEKLAAYTRYFGPDFVGMTGTQKQLKALAKRYRVTYGYDEPQANDFYLVAHSSGVFVFGPDGKARLLFNDALTPDQMTVDLHHLIKLTG